MKYFVYPFCIKHRQTPLLPKEGCPGGAGWFRLYNQCHLQRPNHLPPSGYSSFKGGEFIGVFIFNIKIVLALLFGLFAGSVLGMDPVTSSSGRFVVQGPDSGQNARVAIDAEKFCTHLEELLGGPVPHFKNQPILLRLYHDEEKEYGDVRLESKRSGGLILQRIKVLNYPQMDPAAYYARFTQAMLCRYGAALVGSLPSQEKIPDWLAYGTAHLASASLQEEHLALILERWKEGGLTEPLAGFDMSGIFTGSQEELALMCVAFEWLVEMKGGGVTIHELLKGVLSEYAPTAEAMAVWAGLPQESREQNMRWDLWLAAESGKVRPNWKFDSAKRLQQLRDLLLIYPGEYTLPLGSVPAQPITWDRLALYKERSWASGLNMDLIRRLQKLAIGAEPAFQKVLHAFSSYLVYLETGQARSGDRWPDPEEPQAYAYAWKEVMGELMRYEQQVEMRGNYLDQLEQRQGKLRQHGWE